MRRGGLDADGFEDWLGRMLARTARLHHPAEMTHQVAVPDVPAAIVDLVQGAINQPMSIYEMGPAAQATERVVVEWMVEKLGWPEGAGGVLTHGGSLANLTVRSLAARAVAAPDAWTHGVDGSLAVLGTAVGSLLRHAERGDARSRRARGGGARGRRAEERTCRARWRRARPLPRLGQGPDGAGGRGGATSTGLHDDLEAVGAFCRERLSGSTLTRTRCVSALLSPAHRHLLRGIEEADSAIWDAHKMLRAPALAAAVLLRDGAQLEAAFRQKAAYLIYEESGEEHLSLLERQVECTKAAIGMRIFMNLAFRGEEGIGAYVAQQYDKTVRFWELIQARRGFECLSRPESNILCFRYGRDPELQVRLRERLLAERRYHLSSTEVNGERWLRMTVTAPATSEETVEGLLDAIEELVPVA